MVLRSMHECMHAARFCSGFFFFFFFFFFWHFSSQNSSQGFAAIEIVFTLFYCATSGAVQSTVGFVKQKFDKRDSCGTRGIGLWLGRHFALHNYACSITIGVDSISSSSQGSLSTGSPSVSSFSSGECGNAILQYCYGFNRRQLWLLAQGLLQSVLSLQVSVAMPYYSIVMVSIGSSSGSQDKVSFSQFLLFR